MFWIVICAILAAAGLLLFLWAAFGWCVMPPRREAVTIYRLSAHEPQLERQVQAFVWSHGSGLAAGRLLLAGGAEPPEISALAQRLADRYGCVEYRRCTDCQESMEWNRNRR